MESTEIGELFNLVKSTGCSVNVFRDYLNRGIDVNQEVKGDKLITVCSSYARKADNHEILRILIDTGTDPDCTDFFDWSALMCAVCYSRFISTENTVRMLIDAGADVNLQEDKRHGTTPLSLAARWSGRFSSLRTVRTLIDAGADINFKNKYGETALFIAVKYCDTDSSTETINVLIEAIY